MFEDVETMVGPKRPNASVCWCLSYRLMSSKENRELLGPARGERVRQLVRQSPPPGVLAYDDDEVVGWAAVHPRSDTSFARNRKIPHVDDVDVWSVWCIRVRPGHRREGISHHLLAGAVEFARANGAVAIEGYPLDDQGREIDSTMAYVGALARFEKAGFVKAADTDSVLNGFPACSCDSTFAEPSPTRPGEPGASLSSSPPSHFWVCEGRTTRDGAAPRWGRTRVAVVERAWWLWWFSALLYLPIGRVV